MAVAVSSAESHSSVTQRPHPPQANPNSCTLPSGHSPWPRDSGGSMMLPAQECLPAPVGVPNPAHSDQYSLHSTLLNLKIDRFPAGTLTDISVVLLQMVILQPREVK